MDTKTEGAVCGSDSSYLDHTSRVRNIKNLHTISTFGRIRIFTINIYVAGIMGSSIIKLSKSDRSSRIAYVIGKHASVGRYVQNIALYAETIAGGRASRQRRCTDNTECAGSRIMFKDNEPFAAIPHVHVLASDIKPLGRDSTRQDPTSALRRITVLINADTTTSSGTRVKGINIVAN